MGDTKFTIRACCSDVSIGINPLMEIKNQHSGMFENIIHIGAHLAQEADLWEDLCRSKIVWVEADPDIFRELLLKIASRNRPELHFPINGFATGKKITMVNLYMYSNDGASNSMYKPGRRFKKYWPDISLVGKKELSQTISLRKILENASIKGRENLLVLDVQGHEWEILKTDPDLMKHFNYVICELTYKKVYKRQPSYKKIVKFLEAQGFNFENKNEQNHFDAHFSRINLVI